MSQRANGAAPRLLAARAAQAVLDQGQALDRALAQGLDALRSAPDRSLARRLANQIMRRWPALNHLLSTLLAKPPARRDRLVLFILAVALAELEEQREPAHAVVHSAVEAARLGGLSRLAKLVNAVLRRFQRERQARLADLPDTPLFRYGHPGWLIERLQQDWPEHWQGILEAGNQPPPLWLRVNRRHWSVDAAAQALRDAGHEVLTDKTVPDGLALPQRAAVSALPGFAEGGLSVQDGAAQQVVDYLAPEDGQRVLDACAAPGGKSAHILERAKVSLTALDIDPERLAGIKQSLMRLGLSADIQCGDASEPEQWWDGQPFDRILIDAPCSATGVIRRHPDVRWLRKPSDLDALMATQARLLDRLWPLLRPGGILVYATCSVLRDENDRQIAAFLKRQRLEHGQIEFIEPPDASGHEVGPGRQRLPGEAGLDGFYHCALRRL
ncbi:MAG: 16S rRNA (cytosine(967)-C(5))-methyltransferase RsmB [Wenzhouxiangella sp.]